jgi:hypothetical protein
MKKLLFTFLLLCARLFAANAASVTVQTITVAGSTVTINSTAHGLSVNQGFCLAAPAGLCNVVATATTNVFTFTASGVSACASSCGTVTAAKRAIWLSTQTVSGGYQVNYVLWLTTTSPVAGTGISGYTSATSQEKAALQLGNFIEVGRSEFFPLSTTLANAEAQLQNDYAAQQSQLASSVQPGQFFGNFYDGTGWTQ